jgi:hypothetical protein
MKEKESVTGGAVAYITSIDKAPSKEQRKVGKKRSSARKRRPRHVGTVERLVIEYESVQKRKRRRNLTQSPKTCRCNRITTKRN